MKGEYKMAETYNGWKNRQTWNVALWINNDEPLYRMAREFAREWTWSHKTFKGCYIAFAESHFMTGSKTPDGYSWRGKELCLPELNAMMRDLVE